MFSDDEENGSIEEWHPASHRVGVKLTNSCPAQQPSWLHSGGTSSTTCQHVDVKVDSLHIDNSDHPVAYYPLGTRERYLADERMQRMKEALLERQKEVRLHEDCSFHPRAITNVDWRLNSGNRHGSEVNDSSELPVFERLAQQANALRIRKEEREALRRMQEEATLQTAFRPTINSTSPYEERFKHFADVPVEERLLHYGHAVALSKKMLQEKHNRDEAACARTRNSPSSRNQRGSLEVDRLKKQREFDIRNKSLLQQREIKRAMAEKLRASEFTFTPRVCSNSAVLDQARIEETNSSGLPRTALLYESAVQGQKDSGSRGHHEREGTGQHKPSTNPLSQKWIEQGQHAPLFQKGFVTRQALYEKVNEEHRYLLSQQAEETGKGKKERLSRVGDETIERQVQRLYYNAKAVQNEMRQRQAARVEADECSFRPSLAPGTEHVLRRKQNREPDVVKRLTAVATQSALLKQTSEASVNRESTGGQCSSYNTRVLDPRELGSARCSASSQSPGTPLEYGEHTSKVKASVGKRVVRPEEASMFYHRQIQATREKEHRMRQKKQEEVVQELVHCTFRPKTNSDKYERGHALQVMQAKEDGPPVPTSARVSGVASFLERQALAKRLREEEEERFRNLGRGKPCNGPGHTLFTPFRLTPSSKNANNLGLNGSHVISNGSDETSLYALTPDERERFHDMERFLESSIADSDEETEEYTIHNQAPTVETVRIEPSNRATTSRTSNFSEYTSEGRLPDVDLDSPSRTHRTRSVSFVDVPDSAHARSVSFSPNFPKHKDPATRTMMHLLRG